MKKNIWILAFAALGFVACKSDYLETAPEDQIGTSTILSTTEYGKLALNGICRAMSQQYLETQGLNGEGTILNWYGTFTGNDAHKTNQTGWSPLWNSEYHKRPSSIYLYYPWYYYYKLVSNANGIICNIDAAEGPDAEKAFLKAQALTFRAYSFFRLTQLYSHRWKDEQGNCPGIVLRLDQSTGDYPLSTLAESYAQIYKDLDDAIALYQQSGLDRADFYEPGIDVAYAIYAKAAITREDWQNAAKFAALARNGHKLMTNAQYKDGFHTPNDEWIWGVYDASDQTIYYYSFFAYIASNSNAGVCRNYPVSISKELIDQIPETDIRRSLYLVPQSEEEFLDGFGPSSSELDVNDGLGNPRASVAKNGYKSVLYNRAFKDYGSRLYSTSQIFPYMQFKFTNEDNPGVGRFPIIRAAEMYYIEAEADCHLNKDGEAQQLLFEANTERDASYAKSTKTGADLLTEVKLYRRFDLWGEGNDWFDYKRWGDTLVRKTMANGGSFHATFAITTKPDEGNSWTWMIPEKETDYNDAIE